MTHCVEAWSSFEYLESRLETRDDSDDQIWRLDNMMTPTIQFVGMSPYGFTDVVIL
jgi:hypothetical protein